MEESDEVLIKEYLEGIDESFKTLVYRYTSSIYNYSYRFAGKDAANDITQEVFIKVWKNLKKFDISKSHFKTWIFSIARNLITDYLRKKKMVLFRELDTLEESYADNIEDTVLLPEESMIQLEDKELLNRHLEQIPPHYKEVLILYYQEEMTFKEIGELLGKPLNTVKSYHHRALLKLRELIKGDLN